MNCKTYTNSSLISKANKANTEAFHKRLQQLYPCVEDVTKLPQAWSPTSKASPLGLTCDNLGCYFRGNGRRDEDDKFAAAVRTDNFIPPSCLLYYFEIKFISKGRDGFMGLGLTSSQVLLTKLPGWARESYGYHADDGNTFNGDGRGHPFGPTFTTYDVIGCGYNLVEGKCFFTKNGLNLGKAFKDMPSNILLYPTVGLKTPGEEIKANFGQENFVYDIEQDLRELRTKMTTTINDFPISDFSVWRNDLHKLIQSWLLQNSYPQTAEAFTKSTKIECKENLQRVQQRNRIQQLVLNGKISEAIRLTNRLCPNLLQNNPNLLFALKCRQFVELISGAENDYQPIFNYNDSATHSNNNNSSNGLEHRIDSNGDQADSLNQLTSNNTNSNNNGCNGMTVNNNNNNNSNNNADNNNRTGDDKIAHNQQSSSASSLQDLMEIDQPLSSSSSSNLMDNINHRNNNNNNNSVMISQTLPPPPPQIASQPTNALGNNHTTLNQQTISKSETNGNKQQSHTGNLDADLDYNEQKYERLLQFGRELSNYLQHLDHIYGKNEKNEKMLQDTISLIAFTNPKTSCFGKLLDPTERGPISQLLNNSIVRAEMGDSYRSPLEEVMSHIRKVVKLNDSYGKWIADRLY